MVTINEIAQIAGVSRGTVDRVLNNRGGVSPKTAEKVRRIANSLNYSPNIAGRSLAARKKALKFGVILYSDIVLFDSIENGIDRKSKELTEYGVELMKVHVPFHDIDSQINAMKELASVGVCGIVISPPDHPDMIEMIDSLYHKGIMTVTYNSDVENSKRLAYVGSNYRECGRVAGNILGLLSGFGQSAAAVVSGERIAQSHPERAKACIDKLLADYPEIRIADTAVCKETDTDSYHTVSALLAANPDIRLLFLNDLGVRGGVKAVQESNRRIHTVVYDRVSLFQEDLRQGRVSFLITQQPWILGELPLDILFRYFALDIKPTSSCYLTDIEIKVAENLRRPFAPYPNLL